MTPLIAMPDLRLVAEPGDRGSAAATLPDLPALSALLRGATRLPLVSDWRSGVLAALAMPESAAMAPAVIAARAIEKLPPGGACLATPVHVVAGISRMFLATADSFALAAAEREALREAFNAEFSSPDLHLHAVGSGWLLQAPFAAAADDASPESLIGAALARAPARGDSGRSLRRLGAEVEMWLAGLQFNREREKRGAPPINCIWFWGGGVGGPLPLPGRMPGGLFSNAPSDAWLAGLAGHCGLPLQQVRSWEDVRETAAALVILQPSLPGDVMQHLHAWEAAWLEPARRDLDARRLPALRLQIGASAWQLPAPRLSRWWRRARPWWQEVSA